MSKLKYLTMGIVAGIGISLGASVMASPVQSIMAQAVKNMTLVFNGEEKDMPDEYSLLVYKDRTYIPVRFFSEELGADVDWNEYTRTVSVTTKESPIEEPIEEEPTKEEPKEEENKQPSGDYRELPITKYYEDMEITVTNALLSGDYTGISDVNNQTRLYMRVENKGSAPLQLLHSRITAIVDGKEYRASDVPFYQVNQKWYHNISKDEVLEEYISLPVLPEDAQEMKLKLVVLQNDWTQKETEVVFDIQLDLD